MKERDDMYFPYLRGRQFELIALRELVEKDVLSSKIIPVIEPVKLSSTLLKTIEMYGNNNKKLAFITNPGVGSFKSEWREEKNKKLKENLKEYLKENDNILYMHILKPHENQDDFINKHAESMGTICDNRDKIDMIDYEESVINKVSADLNVDKSQINCRYISSKVQEKYSESHQENRIYNHRLYEIKIQVFPEDEQKENFVVNGRHYYWMSISDMERDPNIVKKNLDVIDFVKESMHA